jgi:hypothetical protein
LHALIFRILNSPRFDDSDLGDVRPEPGGLGKNTFLHHNSKAM